MAVERLILGITSQSIDTSLRRVAAVTDEQYGDWLNGEMERLEQEQPELSRFLIHASLDVVRSPFVYMTAIMSAYHMIPDSTRSKRVTTEETQVAHQSLKESSDVGVGKTTLNLRWYADKIEGDSPDFVRWISAELGNFPDRYDQQDFFRGAMFTVLPFYMREEARRLEESFQSPEIEEI